MGENSTGGKNTGEKIQEKSIGIKKYGKIVRRGGNGKNYGNKKYGKMVRGKK
jgi:hypothetical protein